MKQQITKYTSFLLALGFWLGFAVPGTSQIDSTSLFKPLKEISTKADTLSPDDLELLSDTLSLGEMIGDSTQMDSLSIVRRDSIRKQNDLLSRVELSDDALDQKLDYSAEDSSIYDMKNQTIYLFGKAKVKYGNYNLEAGHISFNWKTNEVIAQGIRDSADHLVQIPVFKDDSQTFEAKHIRFNFKSKKGIVKNVVTKQGNDLYVLGTKAKISSVPGDSSDTKNVVYSEDAIFTTCDHPTPHFGIRSQKQKVVPNKLVVVGPSNLELGGISTPLWLPFGFYPISTQGSTGLIFPRDIENDNDLGFGLKGVGWFFPLGDYANLSVTGDYYVRGTWGLNLNSNYKKRYKYNGNLTLSYSSLLREDSKANTFRTTPMRLTWRHNQDSKAHPTNNFSGSVNISTNGYNQTLRNDAASVQNNQLTSSITYTKRFTNKPYTFSASFNHNQNTRDSTIRFTFPNLLFTTGNFKPFKSKTGKSKWFENFAFSYRGEMKANFETKDSLLFTNQTLESVETGTKHTLTGNFNTNIFKYLNFNVSTSFTENIYLKSFEQVFDPTIDTSQVWQRLSPDEDYQLIRIDTTSYGSIVDTFKNELTAFHNLRPVTAGFSTKIFSTLLFKKGALRGLRNVSTPNLGFSYTPGYSQFFGTVDTDVRDEFNNPREYNRLSGSIYDRPSSPDRNLSWTFSLNNTLEAKVYSRKEKKSKNIKIIESYSLGTSYNFEADSMKLRPASFRARTSFLKKSISLNFNSTLNFYQYDVDLGKRIDKTLWEEEKRLFEATNTALTVTGRTSVRKLIDAVKGNEKPGSGAEGTLEALLENFSLRYNLTLKWDKPKGRDTFFVSTNTLDINGNLDITDKWSIRVGQIGYNFVQKRVTYPDFTFARDLHCWQMAVSWYPNANSFTFTLGVKPGTLEFIKVPYQRSRFEGGFVP